MADSKITALAALTAADPANDMVPIVDVSDTSMAASGTTKRISINNILACSPSATLASATISGDLTVDTSTLKVDSANDRVGIGTPSPAYKLEVVAPAGNNIVSTFRSGDATAANNAGGGFQSISSATAASRVARVWLDADGADLSSGDYFFIQKNGNSGTVEFVQSSNAAMTFLTNGTERARFNSTGNLAFANGLGIDFSAVTGGTGTATGNVLNDYEEGTWTPTAGDASSGGNQATTVVAVGRYTKIGRLVIVHFELTDINTTGLNAGNSLYIRGLPFTASGATTQYGTITGAGITFSGFLTCGVFNASAFPIYATSTGGSLADIKVSGFASGTADIFGTLTYFV